MDKFAVALSTKSKKYTWRKTNNAQKCNYYLMDSCCTTSLPPTSLYLLMLLQLIQLVPGGGDGALQLCLLSVQQCPFLFVPVASLLQLLHHSKEQKRFRENAHSSQIRHTHKRRHSWPQTLNLSITFVSLFYGSFYLSCGGQMVSQEFQERAAILMGCMERFVKGRGLVRGTMRERKTGMVVWNKKCRGAKVRTNLLLESKYHIRHQFVSGPLLFLPLRFPLSPHFLSLLAD